MVESGDWLVPRHRGEPFYDKPALTYWSIGASFEALGTDAGAGRLPSAVAFLGVLLAASWLGRQLFDASIGSTVTWMLITTPALVAFGRTAMSDMLLTLWTTLAAALITRIAWRRDQVSDAAVGSSPGGGQSRRAAGWSVVALGAVMGLGFQTKGPIAILIPGLFALALLRRLDRRLWPRPSLGPVLVGLGAFTVLGLGWFAALYATQGPQPLEWFFLRENLERFKGGTYDGGQPFWYYLPTYLAEGLPWSPFVLLALLRLCVSAPLAVGLLAEWVALTLVPLSLSRGKLDYYLLPLYPALALCAAWFWSAPKTRAEVWISRGCVAVLGLVLGGLAAAPPPFDPGWLPAAPVIVGFRAALIVMAAGLLLLAWRFEERLVVPVLAGSAAVCSLFLFGGLLPAFREAQPNSAIAGDVARERRYLPGAQLVYCADPARAERDVLFSARHTAWQQCELWAFASDQRPFLFLLTPEEERSLRGAAALREVGRYPLLDATALGLRGLLSGVTPSQAVLLANFATTDPVAEKKRKRDFRKERKWELRAEQER